MKLDIAANEFLRENDVAADVANAFLFEGRNVIGSEDLFTEEAVSGYTDPYGKGHKLIRDCAKTVRNAQLGEFYLFFENQSFLCRTMPVRNAGYAYSAYRRQVRAYQDRNEAEGNPAFVKEIHDWQELIPVAVVVLYWGEEPWTEPLALRDLFGSFFQKGRENLGKSLDQAIGDNRILVVSLAHLSQKERERLHSDMRYVAEYLACRKDWQGFCRMVRNSSQTVKHMNLLLDVLEALSGDRRFREIKKLFAERNGKTGEEEEVRMCEILDKIEEAGRIKGRREGRREGHKEGRKEGLEQGIQRGMQKGIQRGFEKGHREGLKEGREEGLVNAIQSLVESLQLTPEEAMKVLKIPKKKREYYYCKCFF